MEKKRKLDAMKLIRRIRDQHAKILKGNSPEQIKKFYKTSAEEMDERTQKIKDRTEPD